MAVQNEAQIWAVMGQSGTGKGVWVKSELRRLKPRRILILDPQDEYGAFAEPVTKAGDMARIVTAAGPNGSFKVRYVFPKMCSKEHFERVFDMACQLTYGARNCCFLVEELSNFTTASYAPPLWRRMCNSGRHEGVHVIGCSQFPAQIDKSFLSNATLVHVGFLGEAPHRKAVATRLDVDPNLIRDLPDLHYIEWHRKGRNLIRGEIHPASGRVKEKALQPGDEKTAQVRSTKGRGAA
ncbi:ATP-binding protein [Herbaspirillum robiniae]|uniref:ATP-binding protein n=1 Tax=Herbaspirillum robiniae TaxID=2014887 RepID=UPI001EDB7F44|nr:ATP-binding protein [Herbaspirillum robiniae]